PFRAVHRFAKRSRTKSTRAFPGFIAMFALLDVIAGDHQFVEPYATKSHSRPAVQAHDHFILPFSQLPGSASLARHFLDLSIQSAVAFLCNMSHALGVRACYTLA